MFKLIFCVFVIPSFFLHSSITLKFFPKKPPYILRSFYLINLYSSVKSLEDIPSLNTCCITVNPKNEALKEELSLVKFPKNKIILWIGSSKKKCQLLETLAEEGNTIKTLFSKKREDLEKAYLAIQPDIVLLPLYLEKNLQKIFLKYPYQKKPLAMFYPSDSPARNFIVTLSPEALQKKKSPYNNTESFLLKKLTLTSEGKATLKREKRQVFNTKASIIKPEDKIFGIGKSLEDLKLALGGFFSELEKQNISTSMRTKNFSKHLEAALSSCKGSLYLFTAEKAPYNRALLKKLKEHFKKHPDKSIFIGYYAMPWDEKWNLYHYHTEIGSPIVASIGLNKLSQNNNLSLESLGGSFAECYLLKRFP